MLSLIESQENIRALALLRGLTAYAGCSPEYISYAQELCCQLDAAVYAASLLDAQKCRPLTEKGYAAIEGVSRAFSQYLGAEVSLPEALESLAAACADVQKMIDEASQILEDPWSDVVHCALPDQSDAYIEYLDAYLKELLYRASVRFGGEVLSALPELKLGEFCEQQYHDMSAMRRTLLRAFEEQSPLETWFISKETFSDGIFPGVDRCWFSRSTIPIKEYTDSHRCIQVAPNVFLVQDDSPIVYCGFGYILGVDRDNILKLTDKKAHLSLPAHCFEETLFRWDDPVGSIIDSNCFSHDDAFCIHPEQLVASLNEWMRNRAEKLSADQRRCVICGAAARRGLFCDAASKRTFSW